jgi:hypothetical protein
MKKIIFASLLVLTMVYPSFAWDPSGTWGIEGRTDAKLEMICSGSVCTGKFQSAYGKFEASGFVRDNKLALVYNYLTDVSANGFGFLVYEKKTDNSMSKKALDLSGKVVGTDNWIRK